MHARHVLAALLLSSLPACAIGRMTVNEPIDPRRVAELVPGTSTAADATRILGAPSEVIQLGARTAYRYNFEQSKHAGFTIIVLTFYNRDTRGDRVWLFFDAADVLTHVGTTIEGDDPHYVMPWQDLEG
jgi:hypothetical protein